MLKNDIFEADLIEERKKLIAYFPEEVKAYVAEKNDNITSINYPVEHYPTKIKSMNLEKVPEFSGVLKGVKGQYLIFEDGSVFNVRNNEGYRVNLTVN